MITKNDVAYIASLSRIHLKEEETEKLTKNLGDILHYVDKLEKLDVSSVAPTFHVLPIKNVFREDSIRPSLPQKDVLKFSVSHTSGSFKVPQVIE